MCMLVVRIQLAEECLIGVTFIRYQIEGLFEADVGDNGSVFIGSIPTSKTTLVSVSRMTSRLLN